MEKNKKYQKPELEIILFNDIDIITGSEDWGGNIDDIDEPTIP